MSWEKVSGIRFNYDKNILDLKSHSNNDNADPSWWSFCKNKDIKERVLELYKSSYLEGEIKLGGLTGHALNFKYGFIIYNRYLKEHREQPTLDNVGILIIALKTRDTKDYCYIKYGNTYVDYFGEHQFGYIYSDNNKYGKHFSFKQAVVFMNKFNEDYHLSIEYTVDDDAKRSLNLEEL